MKDKYDEPLKAFYTLEEAISFAEELIMDKSGIGRSQGERMFIDKYFEYTAMKSKFERCEGDFTQYPILAEVSRKKNINLRHSYNDGYKDGLSRRFEDE